MAPTVGGPNGIEPVPGLKERVLTVDDGALGFNKITRDESASARGSMPSCRPEQRGARGSPHKESIPVGAAIPVLGRQLRRDRQETAILIPRKDPPAGIALCLAVACAHLTEMDKNRELAKSSGKYKVKLTEDSETVQGQCRFIPTSNPLRPDVAPTKAEFDDYLRVEAV